MKAFKLIVLPLLLICLTACIPPSQNKKPIRFVYVAWDGEIAATNVMKIVVEKLGYRVDIDSVSTPVMWQSVASGQADAMFAAWLPTADQSYWARLKDKVDDRGANFTGTRQGFVVPQYVTIDSLTEMSGVKDRFQSRIIGIDPGAGTTIVAEEAMAHYGLDKDFELIQGNTMTMLVALQEAIRKQEWIAIIGWSPHWMWKLFDLKYLGDPDLVMGEVESVHTLVRQGFAKDYPDVYKVISAFHWTEEQILPLLLMNEEGGSAYENAEKWVGNNKELVLSWFPEEERTKITL